MQVLTQVLKRIYQDLGVLYPPAERVEIHSITTQLFQNGHGYLPADYRDFLMLTDGLFWNGIEIFATREHERDRGAFFHRALLPMQASFSTNNMLKNKIVIGVAPEELIVYDSLRKEYQLLDRYSYTVFVKFPAFADVLFFYVRNVIEK